MKEHVLVVIKPDGITKGLMGHILTKFSTTALELVATRVLKVSRALAEDHYQHIQGQPFYDEVIDYLLGKFHNNSRVMALVYSGDNAVSVARELAGATNPEEASPSSIRGAYGRITTEGVFENVVHVSSDSKEAQREIKLWFTPDYLDDDLYPTKTVQQKSQTIKVWA